MLTEGAPRLRRAAAPRRDRKRITGGKRAPAAGMMLG